jgi:hypothetical protein
MAGLKKSRRKRSWISGRSYGKIQRWKFGSIRARTLRIRKRKNLYRNVLIGPVPATVYHSPPLLDLPELAKIPALAHLDWK